MPTEEQRRNARRPLRALTDEELAVLVDLGRLVPLLAERIAEPLATLLMFADGEAAERDIERALGAGI